MEFFANPWFMAAGGALISSPILIHLINRMRFKRVRWAAMEFLLKSQKRNRRRLIIEQLILLLLRILLVLLAAFLLARYLYSGTPDQGGTQHFVIFDDGLSMTDHWKEEGKTVNSFVKAKQELVNLAKEAQKANSAQEMSVYMLSNLESPIFEKRLTTGAIDELIDALDRQKPTALHLSPADGIEKGAAYLIGQPQGTKILHYVGDFRENKWVTGPEGERTIKAVDKTVEAGINVSLLDVAPPARVAGQDAANSHDNLAIIDMRAETRIVAEGVPVEFTVTLRNYSSAAKKTFLKIYVDGKQNFTGSKQTESIGANGQREERFTLVFEKKKQAPEIRPNDPPDERERKRRADQEFIHISAEIEPEETGLHADNFRDMVIEIRKKVPVLVIDGNDGTEGLADKGDMVYVESALNKAALKVDRAYEVERHTVEEMDKLNFDLYPSIYLLNVREIKNEATIAKLADYVKRGGSVAYFLGPKTYVPFYNEKLHKEQKGLFPVLLQPNPTPALTDEERDDRMKKDEQPKILFRYKPPADKDAKVANSNPDRIVSTLAKQSPGVYRYVLIDRYHPAQARFLWDTDPNEKVQDVILLPNRNSMDVYKQDAQRFGEQARDLAKELTAKDKEFEKYQGALAAYRREVQVALGTEFVFNLAAAFDHMLNDVGVPGDDRKPNMTNLWAEPTMKPLAEQIRRFIETVRYGDPLVVARPYGKGRIVACLTTAGGRPQQGSKNGWNDWGGGSASSWTYPIFFVDLQIHLDSGGGDDLNHLVGDKLAYQLDAARYKNEVKFFKQMQPDPDAEPKTSEKDPHKALPEQKLPLPEIVHEAGNQLDFKLSNTKQAGLYTFEFTQLPSDAPEVRSYAFNVDAASESDLRRGARDKIERNPTNVDSKRGKISLVSPGEAIPGVNRRAPDASESPWLYLLILVILVVEQALAVHLSFHLRGDSAATTQPSPMAAAA